jgi:50S ribosomal protein 6
VRQHQHARHYSVGFPSLLVLECSSRPQKKGTKHHMKTRPTRMQPWDIKRRPTQYPPLPPLPPDWTLIASSATAPMTPVLEVAAAPATAD